MKYIKTIAEFDTEQLELVIIVEHEPLENPPKIYMYAETKGTLKLKSRFVEDEDGEEII